MAKQRKSLTECCRRKESTEVGDPRWTVHLLQKAGTGYVDPPHALQWRGFRTTHSVPFSDAKSLVSGSRLEPT